MEILDAIVEELNEKYFIKIKSGVNEIFIPMSEDRPNEVKSAFNKIITRLKDGVFQIKLVSMGEDLFSLVASEYITQLNREIQEVFGEMNQYGLVDSCDQS